MIVKHLPTYLPTFPTYVILYVYVLLPKYLSIYTYISGTRRKGDSLLYNEWISTTHTHACAHLCNEVEINHRVGDTTSSLSYRMSTKQLASVASA